MSGWMLSEDVNEETITDEGRKNQEEDNVRVSKFLICRLVVFLAGTLIFPANGGFILIGSPIILLPEQFLAMDYRRNVIIEVEECRASSCTCGENG